MATIWLLFAAILVTHLPFCESAPNAADPVISKECSTKPLQILYLFDLSPTNTTDFSRQQNRVVETIRHIDAVVHQRSVSFGFVMFHRLPVLLSPLNSPKSADSSKVTEQVQSIRPRRHADTSPAKALDVAAEQIDKNGRNGAKSIVFLVHDGSNSDLIAETLEAVERLRGQNAEVFAISGSEEPNLLALAGYTRHRDRIYSSDSDRVPFLAELDRAIGFCSEVEKVLLSVADSIDEPADEFPSNTSEVSSQCDENQVDLMVVLDTSGSVFKAFAEEREFASNLIRNLEPAKFEEKMQVGLVSFASEPLVLLPLSHGRTPSTVINRIQNVEFTGMNTRIVDAVELALKEMAARRRTNALQVIVLITDGHGQEFWSQAQAAGKKLQESGAEVFVATTLTDYNLPEMLLYAGNESRVFVGAKSNDFLPTVAKLINKCVGEENYVPPVLPPKTASNNTLVLKPGNSGEIGTILASKDPSSEDAENDESGEFLSVFDREEARKRAEQLRKFLAEQKGLPKSADCDTDLVFVVEKTLRQTFNFSDQLELVVKAAESVVPQDVASGKVRLGLVTFSRQSQVIVPLKSKKSLTDFASKVRSILPFHSTSSLDKGLEVVLDEVSKNRRKNARLVIVLVASGKLVRISTSSFDKLVKKIKDLENSDVFAVSLNPTNNANVLIQLTGDRWRVFVDARIRQFGRDLGASLTSCSLAARETHKEEDEEHEPENSVEKVEHLALFAKKLEEVDSSCGTDPVDLMLILDISTSDTAQFDDEKRAAMDLLKQVPFGDFGSRVKVGITTFNQVGRTVVPLNNSMDRESLLFAVDRIEHTAGQPSAVAGISQAIADISQSRRIGARLVVVLVSDGNSGDGWSRIQKAGNALRKTGADVYAIALSKQKNDAELAVYTDSKKRVFSTSKANLFILSAKKILFGCSVDQREKNLADVTVAEQEEAKIQHVEAVDKVVTPKPTSTPTLGQSFRDEQGKEMFKLNSGGELEKHVRTLFSDDCTVDLMFIVDTSQSVANEFQKQLQFAVDLVKRLPDDDFENRVNVATVSFYKTAKVEFQFGQFRHKTSVLDALFAIKHTGGSTSAVSGVKLAVEEIIRGRRPGARLMVVLISDGNSQDLWENVVAAAEQLRSVKADVYAVTVSHDYFFRELELYTGNKWFVYIDARIRQFLDEAELSVVECRNPSIPAAGSETGLIGPKTKIDDIATTLATMAPSLGSCQQDLVDLMIVLDTSTSVEKEFYAEKNFALDLVKVLPETDFSSRIRIGLIKFNSKAESQFSFGEKESRNDILYELERIEYTGGQTSLVSGISLALNQFASKRRPGSRLVTIIVSDGNSQDEWPAVQATAKKLKNTGSEIYAVTVSTKYYFDELKEYTGNERHVYADERIGQFIQDVGQSVVSCPGRAIERVTLAPNVEVSVTPTTLDLTRTTTEKIEKLIDLAVEAPLPEFALARDSAIEVVERQDPQFVVKIESGKCKYSKMDLIMILDASTSRSDVFEHQRELALSLVERLPISKDNTHVATGLNSFTSVPTLRQTLGLGRDKLMVRHAIEDIKYRGGSTLTSKAVELAVKDLERGRRPDALQVVVLMNDGMSQDPWDKVLAASERLKATGAERFGVALGNDIDLRELRHYIGNDSRIYRDGSTEQFLSEIVNLLNGGEIDCQQKPDTGDDFPTVSVDDCAKPKLDFVVVFDASDNTPNQDDPKITSNKYLLLDVLGSLPVNEDVKVSITSFGPAPKLEHQFSDPQDRDSLFERIESIQPVKGQASYAKAVQSALEYYNNHKRSDARGVMLIVGDGESDDKKEDRNLVANTLRKNKDIECHAVDSGKTINERELAAYTGDVKRVYNYDRNSDFAHEILRLATLGHSEQCLEARKQISVAESVDKEEQTYSTIAPFVAKDVAPQNDKDIGASTDKQLTSSKAATLEAKTTETTTAKTSTAATTKDATTLMTTKKARSTSLSTTTASTTTTATTTGKTTVTTEKPLKTTTKKLTTMAEKKTTPSATTVEPSTTEKPLKTTTVKATTKKLSTTAEKTSSATTAEPSTTEKPSKTTTKKAKSTTTEKSTTEKPTTSKATKLAEKSPKTTTVKATTTEKETTTSTSKLTTLKKPTTTSTPPTTTKSSTKAPIKPPSVAPTTAKPKPTVTTTKTPLTTHKPDVESSTAFVPGCLIDLMLILDSSGSVEDTFNREKELAAGIIDRLRVGPENARVALIKFAGPEKVRTVLSFDGVQHNHLVVNQLNRISFSSGTTAIHKALVHAASEYSPLKGARPGKAAALAVIFTDGFSQKDTSKEATLLRKSIPDVYAVAINHDYPISRVELEKITGDPRRVFTDSNIEDFHRLLNDKFRTC